ncbi:MAG: gene transfer agent family protein [Hyphomicrobiales bacterium]|nr:gene transfer agent family protein [Hyphomicrobiales bacterium]
MANARRGEISIDLGGAPRRLCLTLGALAELEDAFACGDLIALAERFQSGRLSARDIVKIIGCGLRGAGENLRDEDVARMQGPEGLGGFVRAAADLIAATFGEAAPPARPPGPQGA